MFNLFKQFNNHLNTTDLFSCQRLSSSGVFSNISGLLLRSSFFLPAGTSVAESNNANHRALPGSAWNNNIFGAEIPWLLDFN